MLAIANFRNPLFLAVLVAWIMSVVLHEFAHGIVAYWGGDYTIRERGGLTLNPFQYVDPVMSLILPVVFLLMGGIPLPGGSTYIRRDLLRGRGWDTAVSLAGPAVNLLLFFACALPLHPRIGWLNVPNQDPTSAQLVLGAMAGLQMVATVLNLIPVPPLDGYQALSPWLPGHLREKLSKPPWNMGLMVLFFVILWSSHFVQYVFTYAVDPLLNLMGFGDNGQWFFQYAWNHTIAS